MHAEVSLPAGRDNVFKVCFNAQVHSSTGTNALGCIYFALPTAGEALPVIGVGQRFGGFIVQKHNMSNINRKNPHKDQSKDITVQ